MAPHLHCMKVSIQLSDYLCMLLKLQLVRFDVFLLSTPVEKEDCKRLFKNLALFYTKTKNQMHISTIFESAAAAYFLKHKYSKDFLADSRKNSRVDKSKKA